MSIKGQAAWIVKGATTTDAALQQLGADLRDLQQKVDRVSAAVDQLSAQVAAGTNRVDIERLDSSVAEMRRQLRDVTDDLGDRLGAVSAFIESTR